MFVLLDRGTYILGCSLSETLVRIGYVDVGGQTARGCALGKTLSAYMCHHVGPLMGQAKPHAEGDPGPMNL
jgi:hypothetical protein